MTDRASPVIILSGAGGGSPNPAIFKTSIGDLTRFELIGYPGWRRYVEPGFSADGLITDLVGEIEKRVPPGPIRIIGVSIGGHFGYAAALRLAARGREISGFCAIDAFMVSTAAPSAGWKARALAFGAGLLRDWRIGEFARFVRSRFWRALLRLSGGRLIGFVRRGASADRLPWILALDPIFESELSMRLLILEAAPWIASLDRAPVALKAPAALLRTAPTAGDDAAWRRRCPAITIVEIPGSHHTLFKAENVATLRASFITATRNWR